MSDTPAAEQCEREIREMHRVIRDWLAGTLPDDDAGFAGFRDVLAPDFEIVYPNAERQPRAELLDLFRGAHGMHAGAGFDIAIRNVRDRFALGDARVLTYEEWQTTRTHTDARLTTVIFHPDPAQRNGVAWLHVHETALPESDGFRA